MAGIGMIGASGIDTTALIENLRAASSAPITLLQQQARDARSASAQLSSLGTTLSSLRTAAAALDTANEVASFTVTQSNTNAFTTTSDGSAQPGTYAISVTQLAKEQRTYSKAFTIATAGTALGITGTFNLSVGSGTAKEVAITASDTLETVSSRINGLGLRLQASIFQAADGKFRLQVRGLDMGTTNAVNFGTSGTATDGTTALSDPLGLTGTGALPDDGKTVQSAQNAIMKIDGFNVERGTNQITGAVSGLSFSLKDVTNASGTDAPVTLNVATDTAALIGKLQSFVGSFNTVVGSVNKLSGIGSTPAAIKSLSGDSTLRSILQDIRAAAQNSGPGQTGGLYSAMRDVGVTIQKDGTLAIDNDKLTKAIVADPTSIQKLLARPLSATDGGVMAEMRETVDTITNFTSGKLQARKAYFDTKAKKADESATKKNEQLDAYAERLRKAFTAMDDAYAKNQNLGAALSRMG